MLYGVDVHARYQATLDVPLLARQGYTFMVTKATEGLGVVSVPGFSAVEFTARVLTWLEQARDAGMIVGLYHYLRSQDGAAQCDAFWRVVEQAGGPDGLLIQLDCEADGYGPQMTQWAARWHQLAGEHPFMVYSGSWWWPKTGGFNGAALTPYLWHSHYLSGDADRIADDPAVYVAQIPASWWTVRYGGWSTPTLLQFCAQGDAGSVANNVDLNVTKLTREQLLTLAGVSGGNETVMLCKFGDKGPIVQALQYLILQTGGHLPSFGADGDYGSETATGLAGLVGGDGRTYGPSQYGALAAALSRHLAVPGPQGPQGETGPAGVGVGTVLTSTITGLQQP